MLDEDLVKCEVWSAESLALYYKYVILHIEHTVANLFSQCRDMLGFLLAHLLPQFAFHVTVFSYLVIVFLEKE